VFVRPAHRQSESTDSIFRAAKNRAEHFADNYGHLAHPVYMDEPIITSESATELTLVEAIPLPALDPNPKQARTAIKHCCAAWQRSYDAYMAASKGSSTDALFAAHNAGPAYCKAMPPLAGYENIRDFIACVAHGILIEAIPQQRANQLLYAAQVALASLHFEPKQLKSA
jgi:hypothetical protein